ncbi:MAG: hypothetical protein IPN25_07770 [Sphingobacteriales bacterium]|nr:hypothetical protein [Sphingobacteriales bacterium]MBK8678573.1 hypothetical protein [Sphingobacteriales bacterium]
MLVVLIALILVLGSALPCAKIGSYQTKRLAFWPLLPSDTNAQQPPQPIDTSTRSSFDTTNTALAAQKNDLLPPSNRSNLSGEKNIAVTNNASSKNKDAMVLATVLHIDNNSLENLSANTRQLPGFAGIVFPDSVKPKTLIEDFTPAGNLLTKLAQQLNNAANDEGKVRIGFFGDSFIEGDILVGDVREQLQFLFGGIGVGYMPITSLTLKNQRPTVEHDFSGWTTYNLLRNKEAQLQLGFSGQAFAPEVGNMVHYGGTSFKKYNQKLPNIAVFYQSDYPVAMQLSINQAQAINYVMPAAANIQGLAKFELLGANAKQIDAFFDSQHLPTIYGFAFEDQAGVYVNNFAVRGNSGIALDKITDPIWQSFDTLYHHQLIFLQFGPNIISSKTTQFGWYERAMSKVISRLQAALPNTAFILLGVNDIAYLDNGVYKTVPAVLTLEETQRNLAKKHGIGYWSILKAMGGEGSMAQFGQANPPLANKDFVHVNFKGGKIIANRLIEALLYKMKFEAKAGS